MIDFRRISLSDRDWMIRCIRAKKDISCEYAFGNLYGYGRSKDVYAANCAGCLVSKWDYEKVAYYCFPIGSGDIKTALNEVVKLAKTEKKKAQLFGMTAADAEIFKSVFGDEFEVKPNRNAFDYFYNSEDLIDLKGKKYQPKRNHISFFKRNFNWSYETITKENIPECLEMSRLWLQNNHTDSHEDLEYELKIIEAIFESYEELGFVGGLIRVDGKVIAYSMGEELNDETFCVHFEKAFSDIRGAYPMINQQFVENELKSYKYIDREDDVGLENLRKAKLSYHPAFLFEKYEAAIK